MGGSISKTRCVNFDTTKTLVNESIKWAKQKSTTAAAECVPKKIVELKKAENKGPLRNLQLTNMLPQPTANATNRYNGDVPKIALFPVKTTYSSTLTSGKNLKREPSLQKISKVELAQKLTRAHVNVSKSALANLVKPPRTDKVSKAVRKVRLVESAPLNLLEVNNDVKSRIQLRDKKSAEQTEKIPVHNWDHPPSFAELSAEKIVLNPDFEEKSNQLKDDMIQQHLHHFNGKTTSLSINDNLSEPYMRRILQRSVLKKSATTADTTNRAQPTTKGNVQHTSNCMPEMAIAEDVAATKQPVELLKKDISTTPTTKLTYINGLLDPKIFQKAKQIRTVMMTLSEAAATSAVKEVPETKVDKAPIESKKNAASKKNLMESASSSNMTGKKSREKRLRPKGCEPPATKQKMSSR